MQTTYELDVYKLYMQMQSKVYMGGYTVYTPRLLLCETIKQVPTIAYVQAKMA